MLRFHTACCTELLLDSASAAGRTQVIYQWVPAEDTWEALGPYTSAIQHSDAEWHHDGGSMVIRILLVCALHFAFLFYNLKWNLQTDWVLGLEPSISAPSSVTSASATAIFNHSNPSSRSVTPSIPSVSVQSKGISPEKLEAIAQLCEIPAIPTYLHYHTSPVKAVTLQITYARWTAAIGALNKHEQKIRTNDWNPPCEITPLDIQMYFTGSKSNWGEINQIMKKLTHLAASNAHPAFEKMVEWLKGGDNSPSDFEVWGFAPKGSAHYSRDSLREWISGILKLKEKEEKGEKKKSHKKGNQL